VILRQKVHSTDKVPRKYLSSSAPGHSLHSLVEKWIQPAEKSHYRCLRGAAIPTGSRIQYWRARALLCPRAHHLLPLALTNFRRADNFLRAQQSHRALPLPPLLSHSHPCDASDSSLQDLQDSGSQITATWGNNIRPSSLYPAPRRALFRNSHRSRPAVASSRRNARTTQEQPRSLTRPNRSPALIVPNSSSRKAGRPKPKFLRLSLPACTSLLRPPGSILRLLA
jgi:hypothetical protein